MARGPRKLRLIFGSSSLTHYGGVDLLHRFFSRLRLKKLLTQQARLIQRNNRYSVGEMLLALLYPMILGLERIETTQLLRQNGVFQYLTGLPAIPTQRPCDAFCCASPLSHSHGCERCTIGFFSA